MSPSVYIGKHDNCVAVLTEWRNCEATAYVLLSMAGPCARDEDLQAKSLGPSSGGTPKDVQAREYLLRDLGLIGLGLNPGLLRDSPIPTGYLVERENKEVFGGKEWTIDWRQIYLFPGRMATTLAHLMWCFNQTTLVPPWMHKPEPKKRRRR